MSFRRVDILLSEGETVHFLFPHIRNKNIGTAFTMSLCLCKIRLTVYVGIVNQNSLYLSQSLSLPLYTHSCIIKITYSL